LAALVQLSIPMKGEIKERWMELCEQAAVEQDPAKVRILAEEINRLLQEKEVRLTRLRNVQR
jgi:hypothetical protein